MTTINTFTKTPQADPPNPVVRWKGYDWHIGYRWGETIPIQHPLMPWQYFRQDVVQINEHDHMVISLKKDPKTIQGKKVYFGGGVAVLRGIHFGKYELLAQMPSGIPGIWPALWKRGGYKFGEGEVDFCEGFANVFGGYFPHRVKWNFYANQDSMAYHHEKKNRPVTGLFSQPGNRFYWYGFEWTEKKITILFQGKPVFELTDPKYIEFFQTPRDIIVGTGISKKWVIPARLFGKKESQLVIKSINFQHYA